MFAILQSAFSNHIIGLKGPSDIPRGVNQVMERLSIYTQHVNLRDICRFTCCSQTYGPRVLMHAPHCCYITKLSRYQSKGKITCLSILFFLLLKTIFTDFSLWIYLLFSTLRRVIFTATQAFYCCYSDRNSIPQCIPKLCCCDPVQPRYLCLAFWDNGDHFLLQSIKHSMWNLQASRRFTCCT